MTLVAITGANKGIGLEMTKQFLERGDDVIAMCRTTSDALQQTNAQIIEGIDVGAESCVDILKDKCAGQNIDYLINNAGIFTNESLEDMDFDRIRMQFEVNTLGPLRVSLALLPNLNTGSKVFIVSSRVGSLADNSSGGNYGYRISKTAVNMAGVNLAHDLKSKEIGVFLLHPGFVRTNMTSGNGNVEPSQSATNLIDRMDALTLEQTGTFWHAEEYELPW
ncbi:MAG: SDR family oxidoreductase [Pseudomonadota bacterium]